MKTKNVLMLVLTAFIWGTAFVAQSVGMDYLEPFTFNGVRSLIGGAALIPCIAILQMINGKDGGKVSGSRKELVAGGTACGLLLFAASSLQQIGIQYTTAGKAGFITAFYIVIVPVFGIFLRKKLGYKIWTAVVMALLGLYFLCMTEQFSVGKGDILIFACALVFSVHILVIDYFSPRVDGVKMSCIQFFVCGIASLPFMFLLETPRVEAMVNGLMPLLYAGAVLRRGVYSADYRPEECESGHCVPDSEPGVLLLGPGRMGCAGGEAFCTGIHRVRADVRGDYSGAVTRQKAECQRKR